MPESRIDVETYEQHLQWLLELLQGSRWPYSKGLTSWKDPDPDKHELHEACLELERRGQVVRQYEDARSIGWMPLEEPPV